LWSPEAVCLLLLCVSNHVKRNEQRMFSAAWNYAASIKSNTPSGAVSIY
jgi:hypothetical protein